MIESFLPLRFFPARSSSRFFTYSRESSGFLRKTSFTSSILARRTRHLFSLSSRRSDKVGLNALTISSQEPLYSSSFGRLPNGTSFQNVLHFLRNRLSRKLIYHKITLKRKKSRELLHSPLCESIKLLLVQYLKALVKS